MKVGSKCCCCCCIRLSNQREVTRLDRLRRPTAHLNPLINLLINGRLQQEDRALNIRQQHCLSCRSDAQLVMATSSLGIYLLVLLLAPPCGAWFFFKTPTVYNECEGGLYDLATQICCDNHLHDKPAGWQDIYCCGTHVFNPVTHVCCSLMNWDIRVVQVENGKSILETCRSVWKKALDIHN
ncbi:hypothetical protein LSAT2_032583 [Lamellibrachia satsuma]|nr:hypothetical protein LSAT2_032583 [Lamellibrachia satsuma]